MNCLEYDFQECSTLSDSTNVENCEGFDFIKTPTERRTKVEDEQRFEDCKVMEPKTSKIPSRKQAYLRKGSVSTYCKTPGKPLDNKRKKLRL